MGSVCMLAGGLLRRGFCMVSHVRKTQRKITTRRKSGNIPGYYFALKRCFQLKIFIYSKESQTWYIFWFSRRKIFFSFFLMGLFADAHNDLTIGLKAECVPLLSSWWSLQGSSKFNCRHLNVRSISMDKEDSIKCRNSYGGKKHVWGHSSDCPASLILPKV